MHETGIWIGFGLGIVAATAMLVYLVWQVGMSRELTPRQVRAAMGQIVLSVVVAALAGVVGRVLLGHEVGDFGQGTGRPLGLKTEPMSGQGLLLVAAAVSVMSACFFWALRIVRKVSDAPKKPDPNLPDEVEGSLPSGAGESEVAGGDDEA